MKQGRGPSKQGGGLKKQDGGINKQGGGSKKQDRRVRGMKKQGGGLKKQGVLAFNPLSLHSLGIQAASVSCYKSKLCLTPLRCL